MDRLGAVVVDETIGGMWGREFSYRTCHNQPVVLSPLEIVR